MSGTGFGHGGGSLSIASNNGRSCTGDFVYVNSPPLSDVAVPWRVNVLHLIHGLWCRPRRLGSMAGGQTAGITIFQVRGNDEQLTINGGFGSEVIIYAPDTDVFYAGRICRAKVSASAS